MRWIKYRVFQCVEDGENIFINKKLEHNNENIAIAMREAYAGEIEIIDDEAQFNEEPLAIELGGTGSKTVDEMIDNFGLQTKILYGTSEPSGGKDGDIYIQIVG